MTRAPQRSGWFEITNHATTTHADTGTAVVRIYDEIGAGGITAQQFVAELDAIRAPQIELHLASGGGEIFDSLAIAEALRQHPATVTCYVDSLAASGASVVMLAGDRIIIGLHAMVMIHRARGICAGQAVDMHAAADMLDAVDQLLAGMYADRAGGSVEQWLAAMAAETWYSPREAVAAGLADEVGE